MARFFMKKLLKIFAQFGVKKSQLVNGKIYNVFSATPVKRVEKPHSKTLTFAIRTDII